MQDRRVALLAEGVDRNSPTISITLGGEVALLAEGVDRNRDKNRELWLNSESRPPRGGRG